MSTMRAVKNSREERGLRLMNRNGKMVFRVLALFLALLLVIGTIVMPIVFADTDDEAAGDE